MTTEEHRQRIMTKLAAREQLIRAAVEWHQSYYDEEPGDELKRSIRQLLELDQAAKDRKAKRR